MLPRDADRFLSGESIPSFEKLKALEEVAPGLVEISMWPWRALDPECNGEKALTNWEAVMAGSDASEPPAFPSSVAKNRPKEAAANAHAWKMARRFFRTLVSLRRATNDRAYPDTCSCAFRLIKDYGNALVHPAIFDQEQEVFRLVKRLVLERFECAPHTALLLSECARRHSLESGQ